MKSGREPGRRDRSISALDAPMARRSRISPNIDVADGHGLDIGDRQRETGTLQQGAGIADIGERGDAWAGAAKKLGFGSDQAFAKLGERAAAGHRAEKQPVGPQRTPDLDQRAWNVVGLMQRQQRHGEVDAFRVERDVVETADQPGFAAEQGRVGFNTHDGCRLAAGQHSIARGTGQAKQRRGLVEPPPDSRQPFAEVFDGAVEQERCACRRSCRGAALAANQQFGVEDRLHALAPDDAKSGVRPEFRRAMLCMMGNHVDDPVKEFKGLARRAMGWTAGLLFPPACAGCRRHVTQPGTLCGACWPKLKFLERPWCPVMGTPFAHEMGDGFLSAEAIANPPAFDAGAGRRRLFRRRAANGASAEIQ